MSKPLVVDTTALRFNQACIVVLVALAFVFQQPWLALAVGVVLAVGTAVPSLALFQQTYRKVLRPAGLLKARVHPDDPAPHRFAQGVGATFLLASGICLLIAHLPILGWGLALIVVVLAAVNLFAGFCAGCFVYYQLGRIGVFPRVRVPEQATIPQE
jgi:hypothetical protein